MLTIQAKQITYLKKSTLASSEIKESEKVLVDKGQKFRIKTIGGLVSGHEKIELSDKQGIWFVFADHFTGWLQKDFILPVPFFPQTDNFTQPDRTCNSSSCAMAAKFLGANIAGDNDYLRRVIAIGDTTDHGVQSKVLESLGIKSTWLTDLDFYDLDQELSQGQPVVIGILHRGTEGNPKGGHIIVVIGKKGDDYVCHDPYGSLYSQYLSPVEDGKNVVYRKSTLRARWLPEGKNTGWGRIFN